ECFHDPTDHECLEGLIVPRLSIGVVDGMACRLGVAELPDVQVQVVDLGKAVDRAALEQMKPQILEWEGKANAFFAKAYETFAQAKRIHDDWEAIYIRSMNF